MTIYVWLCVFDCLRMLLLEWDRYRTCTTKMLRDVRRHMLHEGTPCRMDCSIKCELYKLTGQQVMGTACMCP